jgi:serine/threonine-protein kinase
MGCRYGAKSTTVSASVTDDRSAADELRVSFRYTVGQSSYTVVMSPVGGDVFEGILGPLARPASNVRIPVYVSAVDAAGNSAGPVGPVYVTLLSYCTPG